jgi:hypothetical protein
LRQAASASELDPDFADSVIAVLNKQITTRQALVKALKLAVGEVAAADWVRECWISDALDDGGTDGS